MSRSGKRLCRWWDEEDESDDDDLFIIAGLLKGSRRNKRKKKFRGSLSGRRPQSATGHFGRSLHERLRDDLVEHLWAIHSSR